MNGEKNSDTIILDLSRSETGNAGREGNLVQIDAQKKLSELIKSQVERLDVPSRSDAERSLSRGKKGVALSYPRPHNAILIEGGRGSGKTTFLLHAIESMAAKDGPYKDFGQSLKVLPMVDPTLIETKQNIIVLILSLIETEVEHITDEYGLLAEARQDLAEGLGLLDGIGHAIPYGAEWEDASWVMSRGLEKASKGHSFERRLNFYLERALALLGARAFVLSFDDLDTNFVHGFTILETIRKYLTSPRLVLILSGDLDLYGRLLRQSIYKNFGEQVLKTDIDILGRKKEDVAGAVLELEEQYLLKIVPPQQRISMLPLGGIRQKYPNLLLRTSESQQHGGSAQISDKRDVPHPAEEQSDRLEKWASERIRKQLLEGSQISRTHPFFTLVEMEHMRLVIGYLRALQRDVEDSRQSVLAVFEARMRANSLPADIIERGVFDYTLRVVFEWFVEQDDASDLLRFGIPSDRNKAIALHCLALSLGNFLSKRLGSSLKTLLAFALPVAMMRRPTLSDKANRSLIGGFLWSQASPSTPELAARIGAIDRAGQDGSKSAASSFGTVAVVNKASQGELVERLYGCKVSAPNTKVATSPGRSTASPALTVKSLKDHYKAKWNTRWLQALVDAGQGDSEFAHGVTWFNIDELLSEDRLGNFSGILSVVVNRRFTAQGTVNRTVSALSLFAVITEMLMDDHDTPASEFAVTNIVPALRLEGLTSDSSPAALDEDDVSEDEKSVDRPSGSTTDESFRSFEQNMLDWRRFARSLAERTEVAPSIIGQIAQRLHDDLISLDSKVPKNWKVGETLHRQITTILHGVISVTSAHVGRRESPKMSDRPLIELLGRLQTRETGGLSPLGAILLSCPLVWAFLDPAEEEAHGGANAVRLRKAALAALTASYPPNPQSSAGKDNEGSLYKRWVMPPGIEVFTNGSATDGAGDSVEEFPRTQIPKVRGFFDLLSVVPRHVKA